MSDEIFTMFDIAELEGWKYLSNKSNAKSRYIVCPFCGTTALKCNITKNFFHCYSCETGGNYYTIYAKLYGITGTSGKSANQIAREEIINRLHLNTSTYEKKQIITRRQPEEDEPQKADEKTLDKTYRLLVENTSLSEKHYQDLIKRGLTDEQIKGWGFRSVDYKNAPDICRRLIKGGASLENVPGFYKTCYGNWTMKVKGKEGYMCPVFNVKGKLIGFQIRLDNPKDFKYLWFSSKDCNCGASSGSPVAYYGPKGKCETVCVVDGILKALVCYCLYQQTNRKIAFIGVPGVSCYGSISKAINELIQEKGVKNIINAYDMDEFMQVHCDKDYKKCSKCPHYSENYTGLCEYKCKKVDSLRKGTVHLENLATKLHLMYARHKWDMKDGHWLGKIKGLDDNFLKQKERRRK